MWDPSQKTKRIWVTGREISAENKSEVQIYTNFCIHNQSVKVILKICLIIFFFFFTFEIKLNLKLVPVN